MFIPDLINALFEISGGFFILLSVIKTFKDKEVKGINWLTTAFFMTWGYWNLYYYPTLDQWYSFAGGLFMVFFNTIWVIQLVYYTRKNKQLDH